MADRGIHQFQNGVKVYDDHLNPPQRERYRLNNIHEVDEEPVFLKILGKLPEDGVFVGLGSAIGYYAILARRLRPSLAIHSFEPLHAHQRAMEENILLNQLDLSSFPIHIEAVAQHDGHTWLMEESYSSALMKDVPVEVRVKDSIKKLLRLFGVRAYEPTHRIKVPTLSLDSIVDRLGGHVDLLQMDVQGLEEEALRGGLRTLKAGSCRTFLVGTHSAELHAACRRILVENGYMIEYDDPDPGIQPDGLLVASKGALRLSEADEA